MHQHFQKVTVCNNLQYLTNIRFIFEKNNFVLSQQGSDHNLKGVRTYKPENIAPLSVLKDKIM